MVAVEENRSEPLSSRSGRKSVPNPATGPSPRPAKPAEVALLLLSALLLGFIRFDAVPAALLTGSVAAIGLPVPMTVALPPPEDRAFADVWSALGGELKPSLDVVVSTPLHSGQVVAAGPPVREGLQVGLSDISDEEAATDVAGHHVEDASRPAMRRRATGR